jgi:NAD(P)H-nitrite reductase large subunit
MELPGKFKMAVSGCNLNCAESFVRDLGLVGKKDGWTVLVGGNVGPQPRIARELTGGLDDAGVLAATEKIIEAYRESANKGERLGKMIERLGLEPLQAALAS